MATALIRGMIRAGTRPARSITASDPLEAARDDLARQTGVVATDSNVEVARGRDVLVLAVKPQSMPDVLDHLRQAVTAEHLVISIAAGVSLATLAAGPGAETAARPGDAEHARPWSARGPRASASGPHALDAGRRRSAVAA